jgi:hypothetical protein
MNPELHHTAALERYRELARTAHHARIRRPRSRFRRRLKLA